MAPMLPTPQCGLMSISRLSLMCRYYIIMSLVSLPYMEKAMISKIPFTRFHLEFQML